MARRTPKVVWEQLCWFIYGPPGIGKSTLAEAFASRGKKPLFLWTSPVKYIDAYKIAIPSWKAFVRQVKKLESERPDKYSAIVIDIVDFLHTHCRKDVLEKRGVEHESDLEYGKGWDIVKTEFTRQIAKLVALGYCVIFVSHSDVREVRGRLLTTKKVVPTLNRRAFDTIAPICDIIGYMGFSVEDADADSGTRKIFFEPSEILEAKDWTGRLPVWVESRRDASETVAELRDHLLGDRSEERPRPRGARRKVARAKRSGSARGRKVVRRRA